MGIPKLLRYLSERYPSLSQTIAANQLPNYDYFYIDLNNLIHKAFYEKSALPLEKVDDEFYLEERVFERILRYIETLHRIVPSRVLFLSIDGVAPRAKWFTQRERRSRNISTLDNHGDEAISSTQFDMNAISPGTTFMANFETVLLDFLTNKIKFHANWQNCDVYVSGSSCPGEGSLKIVDFIRSLRLSKDFQPNQTHCIYSSDNDFLLLGLATHELYISLIQERKKCASSLGQLCLDDHKHLFEVVHFEMLRQYIRMEFIDCKNQISFEFNMDRVVDDWTLLMTLLGNDYMPNLPHFQLDNDALSVIYNAYKETLKTSNGYINQCGFLNVQRFIRLIQTLKAIDFEMYCNSVKNMVGSIEGKMAAINLNNNNNDDDDAVVSNGSAPKFSDFMEMKDQYYMDKLGHSDIPNYDEMTNSYMKTIQWILFYYFRGTCSWSHFYPFACAPFVSDFTAIDNGTFSLNIDKPVNAFTHLLAILPKSSSHLLPKSYKAMMINGDNIPDDLLRKSYIAENNLNVEDEERNTPRPMLKLQYEKNAKISKCVQITEVPAEKKINRIDTGKDVYRPFNRNEFNFKFSTLNLHDYSSNLVKSDCSKSSQRIIIRLTENQSNHLEMMAKQLINQVVYVNWPHFSEAKVIQVFDATTKYDGSKGELQKIDSSIEFEAYANQLRARYSVCGIDVGEIKMIAYVAALKYTEYRISDVEPYTYELTKIWDDEKWEPVAVQTLTKCFMKECMPQLKRARDVLNVRNVFLFNRSSYHYGEMATINDAESLEAYGRVNILATMNQEPDFQKAIQVHKADENHKLNDYKHPSTIATLLGISEKLLARVTGSVLVNGETPTNRKINIGLMLKIRNIYQTNALILRDYVSSNGKQFAYSQLTIDLVQKYMDKFPRVFELLSSSEAILSISDFQQENSNQTALEYLNGIQKWLQSLPHSKLTRTSPDAMHVSADAVKMVQETVNDSYNKDAKVLRLKMKWSTLYIPDLNNVFAVPCATASYKLLDRVVVVRSGYPIPIGAKGTIIAIEPSRNHIVGNDITENVLHAMDILMDEPFKVLSIADEFKWHKIYRTRSTNMLINISYGRAN